MKYKVGDKVRIKPLEWFKKLMGEEYTSVNLSNFCGKVFTIDDIIDDRYIIECRPWREEYVEPLLSKEQEELVKHISKNGEILRSIINDTFEVIREVMCTPVFSDKIYFGNGAEFRDPKLIKDTTDYIDRLKNSIYEKAEIPSGILDNKYIHNEIPIFKETDKPVHKYKDGNVLFTTGDDDSIYLAILADKTKCLTGRRECFLKSQNKYKKGDILIDPLTRTYHIYGYSDGIVNLGSFRIANTDEKAYYLSVLKNCGLQPIPVRKKK